MQQKTAPRASDHARVTNRRWEFAEPIVITAGKDDSTSLSDAAKMASAASTAFGLTAGKSELALRAQGLHEAGEAASAVSRGAKFASRAAIPLQVAGTGIDIYNATTTGDPGSKRSAALGVGGAIGVAIIATTSPIGALAFGISIGLVQLGW